jgi:negative regulator of sigma E activity
LIKDPAVKDDIHLEQLSALLDDELDPNQARFLLRRVAADATMAQRFEQYSLIGEAIRGQAVTPPGLVARVRASLARGAEGQMAQVSASASAPQPRPSGQQERPWAPLLATAVAVLAAVIVVVPRVAPPPQEQVAGTGTVLPLRQDVPATAVFSAVPNNDDEPLLIGGPARASFARYLMEHNGVASGRVRPTFVAGEAIYPAIVTEGGLVPGDDTSAGGPPAPPGAAGAPEDAGQENPR